MLYGLRKELWLILTADSKMHISFSATKKRSHGSRQNHEEGAMQQQRRETPPQPLSYKHNNSHRSKGSPQTTEPNRMINMLFYKIRTVCLLYKRSCSK